MRRALHGLLAGMALTAAVGMRPSAQSAPARPNVLLITIDTLRADRLGAYGYARAHTPVLDRLAREGVRFADATSAAPLTFPSHVALLTGRYASAFGVKSNGSTPLAETADTLAERLARGGYATAAFVSSAILDSSYGLAQGFALYDDDFSDDASSANVSLSDLQRPAAQVASAARRWLDAQKTGPWFAWIHFYDPHLPYDAPAKYRALTPGRPYDAEIAYVDDTIGTLLARIDRSSTAIVIVADHGESLGEHGETDHGFFLYDSTLRVPLILSAPGLAARVVRDQVRTVDVAPTIAALARVDPPGAAQADGASLLPLARGEAQRDVPVAYAETWYPRLHFGWSELRSARVGEWKYIAAPKPELYDLRTDAAEQKNLVADKATVAGRLASDLGAIAARIASTPGASSAPKPPDPEAVRRMQALGYVGSFAPAASGAAGENPADRIGDYQRYRALFNRALGALSRGDAATAVPVFKQLIGGNVRGFEAHLYLGNAYALQKNYDAALGEYDAAVALNPDLASAHFEAAKVFSAQGEVAAAIARCREGLAKEPGSYYGQYTLGVIYQKAGLWSDAAAAFARAVELNTREPRARANLAQANVKLGRLDDAAVQFEKMIELKFQVAPAQFNLGIIAAQKGDAVEAARRYRLALAADPAFKPARDALARLK